MIRRAFVLALLALALSLAGCTRTAPDATPEGAVRMFVEKMESGAEDPRSMREAYQLLGPHARSNLKERADRARAWTDDFTARVTAANDRLTKAEQAWRDAAGAGLDVQGPKDTTPWGLLSWAISTGLLVVLNERRKREARAVLEEAKRESGQVVARQDDAPFVGSGGKLEPEHRLADTPSRIDSIEAALQAAGVLKRA